MTTENYLIKEIDDLYTEIGYIGIDEIPHAYSAQKALSILKERMKQATENEQPKSAEERIEINKSDGSGTIEIYPEVKKLAIAWIENYVPNGSIMPEIAQKFKLAEDIQRIINIRESSAQQRIKELEAKIPYKCKCDGNLDGCANERCMDLNECQDVYIQNRNLRERIKELKEQLEAADNLLSCVPLGNTMGVNNVYIAGFNEALMKYQSLKKR